MTMAKDTRIPDNIINPFSEEFLETWELWKAFRWEEHKFKYRGVISEQMALKRLVTVSGGEEEKAIRIVEQSISRGWMDFYDLKQPNPNGKSRTSKTGQQQQADFRSRVSAAANSKFRGGEQNGSEPNLKAV